MSSKSLILVLAFLVAGCQTTTPAIKVETQKVEIPVAMPCKATVPTPPDYNFPKLTENSDIFDKVKALLADTKLRMAYEAELLAALNSCVK